MYGTTLDTHICSASHSSIGKHYYTQTHATDFVTTQPELCKWCQRKPMRLRCEEKYFLYCLLTIFYASARLLATFCILTNKSVYLVY